jgi:hypothetical protein
MFYKIQYIVRLNILQNLKANNIQLIMVSNGQKDPMDN